MSLLPLEFLLLLAAVALFTGFVKAGVPALGGLISAVVALAFSPREALGICLIYLLIGDLIAVSFYWRLAHFNELKKMIFPVLSGIAAGGVMLSFLDDNNLGFVIGLMVIFLVSLEPFRPRLTELAAYHPRSIRTGSGIVAGISTTIGNAAGPITALYFLLLKLDKKTFMGTSSIFFLSVNTTKIPIFYYQDLFTAAYLPSIALTAPLVYFGALFGRTFLNWVSQIWFTRIILTCTALAGFWLILRYFIT
ncbi:MAG: sulfite exporter TauE/SafE family protein [Gammaproteobacteria bacterium]|nr:sulfite exporter TauE/SafE family protein [Gammaproteobacteria bacterium]